MWSTGVLYTMFKLGAMHSSKRAVALSHPKIALTISGKGLLLDAVGANAIDFMSPA
jgi:hypothetical protein